MFYISKMYKGVRYFISNIIRLEDGEYLYLTKDTKKAIAYNSRLGIYKVIQSLEGSKDFTIVKKELEL